ncbi:hypothetical protein PCIT_b1057 [Pseudoalteromonas citrea]|uniref:Acyltransferase 3 domain-containing protein n=2 Tax=Pseudoalteromonas citrea TaxID=43655 RepID=A0AAD4AFF2_9GAMM|nr:acyltransferase [Pseudoalteromonas citrea]KAF7764950.1 hypothetical protein PCIT_b1057 [Pseudoalteromonas citrea]
MLKRIIALWQSSIFSLQTTERMVELDWLRVLAFGLLIFYHTGMLYAQNWGYHFKSSHMNTDIESWMLLLSPWRMGVIWFISGAALSSILQKKPMTHVLLNRSIKILLPLLVGVWMVVPIQLYAQMQQEVGLSMNYAEFYSAFLDLSHPLFTQYQAGIWPHVDVNHLWYLRSLWQFTIWILVVLPILRSNWLQKFIQYCLKQPFIFVCLGLLLPLWVLKLTWPSETYRYPMGFVFLLYGFLLVHHTTFFTQLCRYWQWLLGLFAFTYIIIVYGYQAIWLSSSSLHWQLVSMNMIYTVQSLLGVLAILALATRFLKRPSKLLTNLNTIVFPFYIFHQSVIIALAYSLSTLKLGPWLEAFIILLGTFLVCAILCSIVAHVKILRPLFGMKTNYPCSKRVTLIGTIISILAITPMAIKLLIF